MSRSRPALVGSISAGPSTWTSEPSKPSARGGERPGQVALAPEVRKHDDHAALGGLVEEAREAGGYVRLAFSTRGLEGAKDFRQAVRARHALARVARGPPQEADRHRIKPRERGRGERACHAPGERELRRPAHPHAGGGVDEEVDVR
jgi:hypothetical protein